MVSLLVRLGLVVLGSVSGLAVLLWARNDKCFDLTLQSDYPSRLVDVRFYEDKGDELLVLAELDSVKDRQVNLCAYRRSQVWIEYRAESAQMVQRTPVDLYLDMPGDLRARLFLRPDGGTETRIEQ